MIFQLRYNTRYYSYTEDEHDFQSIQVSVHK